MPEKAGEIAPEDVAIWLSLLVADNLFCSFAPVK